MIALHKVYNDTLEQVRKMGGLRPSSSFHNMPTDEHIVVVTEYAMSHYPVLSDDKIAAIAMAHDLGKLDTWDSEKKSFPKHEKRSAEIARRIGMEEELCLVIELHGWIRDIHNVSPKGVRRFIKRLTADGEYDRKQQLRRYRALMRCDWAGFSAEGKAQRKEDIRVFNKKMKENANE